MTLTIQPATTIEHCRQVEDLQYRIWGGDPIDVVPDHILITFAKNQGTVLLALEDGQPVGFCYSFMATTKQGGLKHCSHQAGVLPTTQAKGVGYQLKMAQRQAVLKQGIDLISWTFDPMLALNANLNIGKLGAISHIYEEKLYGEMRTDINDGLDSDRLEVAWWLNSPQVQAKVNNTASPPSLSNAGIVNAATLNGRGQLIPADNPSSFTEPAHCIQIPDHIQQLKASDLPLAVAWQQQIRTLFQTAFAQGYTITDFIWQRPEQRGLYYLTKETKPHEN